MSRNTEIIPWARAQMLQRGLALKNDTPEIIVDTPWSYVARFDTSGGYVYLKHTPDMIALEADIIQLLRTQFQAPVPTIIAHDAGLNCFLMADAGRSLRSMLKQSFDTALFCRAIEQFTALQMAAAERVDVFFDIGVPDWRLDKFPDLYRAAMAQQDVMRADGMTESDITACAALLPQVTQLCDKLSAYPVKPSIVQPDFNDNNTLIDATAQNITIIDLGEIVISHPFFSLHNCLQQVRKHHGLTEKDAAYQQIKTACFKNYMKAGTAEAFAAAFETSQTLWIVYRILSHFMLMEACGMEKIIAHQRGKLAQSLKEFIALLS